MGFLKAGTPLTWDESLYIIPYIKNQGIQQLLHVWQMNKDRLDQTLFWGEEIEYSLLHIDETTGTTQIYPEATEVLEELTVREHIQSKISTHLSSEWHPEFGNHMIEAIPSPPYILNLQSILLLEPSMRLRRAKIQSVLSENKFVASITSFPRFGLCNFAHNCSTTDTYTTSPEKTKSIFVPDGVFNPHPRFPTLVQNVIARRSAFVFIKVPIFKDIYTGRSTLNSILPVTPDQPSMMSKSCDYQIDSVENDWSQSIDIKEANRVNVQELASKTINPIKDYIYMDCLGFGMSMSCVQTTFACVSISKARYLYDQLVVLAPLFLALTASNPFHRGFLSDYDTRWSALEQSVDCRTEAEETGCPNTHNTVSPSKHIPKSRYSGVSVYISDSDYLQKHYNILNDTYSPIDDEAYSQLIQEGHMDTILARHFAHLWVRDPLVVFKERIELDNTRDVDHFENIQSTNWNSVRFKPPPPHISTPENPLSPIGWRVEFRSPDAQITDFDNAAGVALISVVAQAILHYNLNLYIPMSCNDINMERSWQRSAVSEQKFFFKRDLFSHADFDLNNDIVEMSLHEILAGNSQHNFHGLLHYCEKYINEMQQGYLPAETHSHFDRSTISHGTPPISKVESLASTEIISSPEDGTYDIFVNTPEILEQKCCKLPYGNEVRLRFCQYAQLYLERSSGKLMSCAQFLRKFILAHPDYKKDSRISPKICYDITTLTTLLGFGVYSSPDLHGDLPCKYLTVQTPLPASLKLPSLSDDAMRIINLLPLYKKTSEIPNSTETTHNIQIPFTVYEKPIIALNESNTIYTMPIGVSARVGQLQRIRAAQQNLLEEMPCYKQTCKNCSKRDLYHLTLQILESNQKVTKPKSDKIVGSCQRVNQLISNEEFTQAWILKGIDCVGGLDTTNNQYVYSHSRLCMAKKELLSGYNLNNSKKDRYEQFERESTTCPSTIDEELANCVGDEDDKMHQLSRSLSLGFNNEQEVEYFRQVCGFSG